MSQPRLVEKSKPRIIDGYIIPGKSIVSVQAWSLHRNPRIFGDDAEFFDPERWLGSEEQVREIEKGFLAFGRGGRACTGREYDYLFVYFVLSYAVPRFSFSLAHEKELLNCLLIPQISTLGNEV